jgi:signal transduction histidine kinase
MTSNRRATSLFQGVTFAIVAGFLALHVGSYLYYSHERMVDSARTFARSVAERSYSLVRHVDAHPDLVDLIQDDDFTLALRDAPLPAPHREWPHSAEIRAGVVAQLTALGAANADALSVWFTTRPDRGRLVLQYPYGGRWVSVSARTDVAQWGHDVAVVAWTTLFVLLVCALVLWAIRRVTRYLPGFADAAQAVGQQRTAAELPEDRGPREIRHLSKVLNDMQRQVRGHLEERSTMLAALSHDLRTYVTRIELRLAAIEDPAERARAEADVKAMTSMLDESLAFARDENSDEAATDLDLATLLESVVDAERDMGGDATFTGPGRLTLAGQRVALERAFTNLVRNAILYGTRADVVLIARDGEAVVEIRDRGPGIPPEQRASVLKPFVRLETSRNRDRGGTGLGLAIANNVVRRHGGKLRFVGNAGDFRVEVVLPRAAAKRSA